MINFRTSGVWKLYFFFLSFFTTVLFVLPEILNPWRENF